MSRVCTPVLVGMASLVLEIWLHFKNGPNFPFRPSARSLSLRQDTRMGPSSCPIIREGLDPPVYEAARGPITRMGGASGSFCCSMRMRRSILAETLLEESSGCVLSLLLLCIPVIGAGDI